MCVSALSKKTRPWPAASTFRIRPSTPVPAYSAPSRSKTSAQTYFSPLS